MTLLKLADPFISNEVSPSAAASPATMAERRVRLAAVEPAGAGSSAPIWEALGARTGELMTSSEVLHRTRSPRLLPPELEHAIVAAILRPLAAGESHLVGNANRERELCGLLARLDLVQSYELGRRLDRVRPDDALATAFGRLIPERRQRVRAFLTDARRRQASR